MTNNTDSSCEIIIVTHNGLEYTKKCIESVEEHTKNVHHKFIFVDNHSTDGTLEYLKTVSNSTLISNKENFGFVKGMNQGLERASASYVVWLNNDTIVTPNWLSYLISHLENESKAAVIGPMSNGTGIIQRDQSWKDEPSLNKISEYGKKFHSKNQNKPIEYHRVAGFCIVMKGELVSKIGKLDEGYNFGWCDDDDFCKRVRKAGYKILIAQDVFIYHKSGATFAQTTDPELALSYRMQKGRRYFLHKWTKQKKKDSLSLKDQPLVSIIMATKDREKIISNAINSILNQTYKNWELVIVNDGGTNLENLISNYSDSRIKYINLDENKGKSYANNIAIEKSNGKIIAYLDDDDRWHQNHLEITIRELLKHKSRNLVYTNYVKVNCTISDNKEQIPTKKEIIELKEDRANQVSYGNFIPNLNIVHNKSLFTKVGNFDEKLDYREDWDMLRRFFTCTHFIHVPEVTGEYWSNPNETTREGKAIMDKNQKNVLKYITSKEIPITNPIVKDLQDADNLMKKNNFLEASNIYKKILGIDPEFYSVVEKYSKCLVKLKKFSEAKEFFNKFEELNPYLLSSHLLAAQNLVIEKEFEEAKKKLEYALILGDDRNCYNLLQNCYKNLGKFPTYEFIKNQTYNMPENINLREVQEFLENLYLQSPFYRKLLIFGYKFLKIIARKHVT